MIKKNIKKKIKILVSSYPSLIDAKNSIELVAKIYDIVLALSDWTLFLTYNESTFIPP
jgi:hypothetical protein